MGALYLLYAADLFNAFIQCGRVKTFVVDELRKLFCFAAEVFQKRFLLFVISCFAVGDQITICPRYSADGLADLVSALIDSDHALLTQIAPGIPRQIGIAVGLAFLRGYRYIFHKRTNIFFCLIAAKLTAC